MLNSIETEIEVFYSPSNVSVVGDISAFIGRNKSDLWLKTFSPASYILDLGDSRKVLLSKYTLRHFSQKCCFLKNWNLEASNDNENWIILQQYNEPNGAFNLPNQTKTFSVDKITTFYRYFKIHQISIECGNFIN